MKTFFPYYFKKVGIILVFIAYILSITAHVEERIKSNNWDQKHNIEQVKPFKPILISTKLSKTLTLISMVCSFSGFFIYMFSSEKIEDEFIQQLRFECLAKSFFITWIVAMILVFISGKIQIHGLFIFQFHLIMYVILLTHKKHVKYA